MGGVTYVELLVKAVNTLQKDERPKLLIISDRNLAAVDLHRNLFPLLDGLLFIGQDAVSAEKILLQPFMHVLTFDELFNLIDFLFPGQAEAGLYECCAAWIPDFQHIHLPNFFTGRDRNAK